MSQFTNWLTQLLTKDPRYTREAYEFLFESLEFTRDRLTKERSGKIKHVTGGELLQGVRLLALQHYGRMAKIVLNQFGIHSTSDIGEMVFNLIESGDMEKTEQDSRDDFDDVYDFDAAFCRDYKIELDELDS